MKNTIYSLLTFLIIAFPIYYLGGSMTGYAVMEDGFRTYGRVSSTPDFSIPSIRQDDKSLREAAFELLQDVKACEETNELDWCIRKNMEAGWLIQDDPVLDMIEQYDRCADSVDNYCICEIDLKKDTYVDGQYEFNIMNSLTGTVFGAIEIPSTAIYYDHYNVNSITPDPDPTYEYEGLLFYDNGLEVAGIKINDDDFNYGEGLIHVFKRDQAMILLEYSDIHIQNGVRVCRMANKRIYRFQKNGPETVYACDPDCRERELQHRFALNFTFESEVSNPAMTLRSTESAITAAWNAERGASYYAVFVSDAPFSDTQDMAPTEVMDTIDGATQHTYSFTQYYKEEQKYPILKNTKYYIAVVAVDKSNNYNSVVQTQEVMLSGD